MTVQRVVGCHRAPVVHSREEPEWLLAPCSLLRMLPFDFTSGVLVVVVTWAMFSRAKDSLQRWNVTASTQPP